MPRTSVRSSMERSSAVLRRSMPSWGSLGEGGSFSPTSSGTPRLARWVPPPPPPPLPRAGVLHMGEPPGTPPPPAPGGPTAAEARTLTGDAAGASFVGDDPDGLHCAPAPVTAHVCHLSTNPHPWPAMLLSSSAKQGPLLVMHAEVEECCL